MPFIEICGRRIGQGQPVFIVAEISANHNQNYEQAVRLIHEAKKAGADAIKLQTYTPDTITIKCNNDDFRVKDTLWDGMYLYDLYAESYMPWEWHDGLMREAQTLGLGVFSTAFDPTAVDFLEGLGVTLHKVASFEIVDIPLIEKIAATGKPLIISTGMATLGEIEEAVHAAWNAGADRIALLKCTSAYPASPDEMNLRTIPHLSEAFGVPVGISDHTLGIEVPIASVALGACIIEKHFTISRSLKGPDSAFSLEPREFACMVEAIRIAERALGRVHYGANKQEAKSLIFRRSLFVVKDIRAGEAFTNNNVRSIRPGYGLHPRHLKEILGRHATRDFRQGTPLGWDMVA
ncbi:MAG: pseudaminic acid synthase [Methanotrichaceae archaeon]|nr:pseudaminic acid synthase [Methanotrichaceae archaeon]MDD1757523.1 pseudaminic acid synthase [Methanotrichaceae archaeon]